MDKNEYMRNWYKKHKTKILALQRKYYQRTKTTRLIQAEKYRNSHQKEIKKQQTKYRNSHIEENKLYQLKYRALNREHLLEEKKKWHKENKIRLSPIRKQYYLDNREYIKQKSQKQYERTKHQFRFEVLKYYSNGHPQCACCGYQEFEFLTIDHINGRAMFTHRKSLGGWNLIQWIRKHNYPKGFQVLCYNCNSTKGFFGQCCHTISYDPNLNRTRRTRMKVIKHYSPNLECKCCKETNLGFLTLDHINGKEYKGRNHGNTFRGLISKGFPKNFQVLCYNCNCAKHDKKDCPHKLKTDSRSSMPDDLPQ